MSAKSSISQGKACRLGQIKTSLRLRRRQDVAGDLFFPGFVGGHDRRPFYFAGRSLAACLGIE